MTKTVLHNEDIFNKKTLKFLKTFPLNLKSDSVELQILDISLSKVDPLTMETIEFKNIPSDRMEKIKELCNMLSAEDFKIEAEEMSDLHGIRMDVYGKNPLFAFSPTRQFYQLVPVPIASVALHDESCGNEELLFETSIYRDLGKVLFSTGWQAIPEVVAMLYAASGRENEEQENNA